MLNKVLVQLGNPSDTHGARLVEGIVILKCYHEVGNRYVIVLPNSMVGERCSKIIPERKTEGYYSFDEAEYYCTCTYSVHNAPTYIRSFIHEYHWNEQDTFNSLRVLKATNNGS